MPLPLFLIPLLGAATGFIMSGGIQDVVAKMDSDPTNDPVATDWAGDVAATAAGGIGGAMAGPWVGAGVGQIGGAAAGMTKAALHPPVNAGAIKGVASIADDLAQQKALSGAIVKPPTNDYNMVIGPLSTSQQKSVLRRVPKAAPSQPIPEVVGPDMVAIDEVGRGNNIGKNITIVPNINSKKYPTLETPEQNARINTANSNERNLNVPNNTDMWDMDQTQIQLGPGEIVNTYLPRNTVSSDTQQQKMLVEWAKQMQLLGGNDPRLQSEINKILSTYGG